MFHCVSTIRHQRPLVQILKRISKGGNPEKLILICSFCRECTEVRDEGVEIRDKGRASSGIPWRYDEKGGRASVRSPELKRVSKIEELRRAQKNS